MNMALFWLVKYYMRFCGWQSTSNFLSNTFHPSCLVTIIYEQRGTAKLGQLSNHVRHGQGLLSRARVDACAGQPWVYGTPLPGARFAVVQRRHTLGKQDHFFSHMYVCGVKHIKEKRKLEHLCRAAPREGWRALGCLATRPGTTSQGLAQS